MRRILAAVVVALIVGGRLTAEAPPVPTLTDVQRLTLAVRQLAARNAALELELYVRELARPGFTLDVATGLYQPTQASP